MGRVRSGFLLQFQGHHWGLPVFDLLVLVRLKQAQRPKMAPGALGPGLGAWPKGPGGSSLFVSLGGPAVSFAPFLGSQRAGPISRRETTFIRAAALAMGSLRGRPPPEQAILQVWRCLGWEGCFFAVLAFGPFPRRSQARPECNWY